MKLKTKITLLSLAVLLVLTVSTLLLGTMIINDIVYEFEEYKMMTELKNIRQTIFQVLNESGLRAAENKAATIQKDLADDDRLGHTVDLYIIKAPDRIVFHKDYKSGSVLKKDFIAEMFQRKAGIVEYNYRGHEKYCVFDTLLPLDWLIGLSITKKDMFDRGGDYLRIVSILAFVVFVLGAITANWFVGRLTRRIEKTLECAKRVETGDLTARIDLDSSRDEIGHLQKGINSMISGIETRTSELAEINKQLTREIEERKLMEAALHKYEHIVSSTSDLMAFVDRNYVCQAVNQAYLKAHNKNYMDIVGHSILELHGEKIFHDVIKKQVDRCLAGEEITFQAWFDYAGLGPRFMDVIYNPYVDEGGAISGIVVNARDITDQEMARKALRDSEERFRELAENIHEVFWLFDCKEQKVLYVSPAYEEIWGRSTKRLYERYMEWGESIHPDDLAFAEESFERIIETGRSEPREYRIVRPDGTIRWILDRGAAIRGEEGEVIRIAGIAEDITERKRMIEEKERLTTILESTSDMVAIATPEGRVTYLNRAGRMLLDWDLQEDISQRTIPEAHPEWAAQIVKNEGLPAAIEKGIWWGETAVLGKNDIEIPVSQVIMSHKTPAGDLNYYSTIVRDISEQKNLEQALAASERNYREIFDKTSDVLFIHDLDGTILDVNQAIYDMTGFTREEALNNRIQDFSLGEPPYTQKEATEYVINAFQEGPQRFEWLGRKKNGELFWAGMNLKHVLIGGQDRIIAAVHDITERKQVETELARHREHLEELVTERTSELETAQDELLKKERLAVLGQLTATVSHELRNPLGVIRSSTFYLQRRYRDQDEKIKKHLNRIEDQVEVCDSIVSDLLEFTRGRHSQIVEGEINPWLERTLNEFPKTEEETIELVMADKLPKVLFDPEKMRRVIVNLVTNSLQAVRERKLIEDEDTYQASVKVSSEGVDDGVLIAVKDNGIGMDQETLERAFEPLYTTKARGTGLGLANVHKIVAEHNGNVSIESVPHKGTTVVIKIPKAIKGRS